MIKFFREIIGTPVLDFEDASPLALIKDIIIDPDTGKIEGLWVKPLESLLTYGVLQTQDILEWKKNLYIRHENVIGDPAEIIKIADILSQKRYFLGNAVRTEGGEAWGKVMDLDFDTLHYYVRNLYAQKYFLGLIPYEKRGVSYDLILEVLPEAIVVKDKIEKGEKVQKSFIESKSLLLDN